MAKDITKYPITFPYNATSWPYNRLRPHKGEDRGAPVGTPVIINGKQIGTVGNTGFSFGAHLHVAKWQAVLPNWLALAARRYFNPKGWSTITGRVVYAGWLGTAGKCVIVKQLRSDKKRVFFMYAHLDRIDVKRNEWTQS